MYRGKKVMKMEDWLTFLKWKQDMREGRYATAHLAPNEENALQSIALVY